jgi:hypothetical protein
MRELKFDLNVDSSALLCPNSQAFYSKAYIGDDVIGNFYMLPGVKTSTKISTVGFDNLLKAANCNFTAGDQTLSGITVDVCKVSALAEICRYDVESSFLALEMSKGANASFEVPSFMEYYWSEMANEIESEIAQIRWVGNPSNTAYTGTSAYLALCTGYNARMLADASVVDVTKTAVTASNVIAVLTAVFSQLPAKLKNKLSDLRFYVAPDVALAYRIASATGNNQAYVTESLALTFLGVPITVQEGMTAGDIVLTRKQNLIYAFDGEGDTKELRAINLEDSIAEPLLRTRANISVGFYIVNGEEIVWMH